MVTKRVPSPKFDTKNLFEVLRDFKHYKIVTRGGAPYRKVYINGDLDVINAAANRVIGTGACTITNYYEDWYCVELVTVAQKPSTGQKTDRPKKPKSINLLTSRWTKVG